MIRSDSSDPLRFIAATAFVLTAACSSGVTNAQPGPPGGGETGSVVTCARVYIGEFSGIHYYETQDWIEDEGCVGDYGTGHSLAPCGVLSCDAVSCGCAVTSGTSGGPAESIAEAEQRIDAAKTRLMEARNKYDPGDRRYAVCTLLSDYSDAWSSYLETGLPNPTMKAHDEMTRLVHYNNVVTGYQNVITQTLKAARAARTRSKLSNMESFENSAEDEEPPEADEDSIISFSPHYRTNLNGYPSEVYRNVVVQHDGEQLYFRLLRLRTLGKKRRNTTGNPDGETLPGGPNEPSALMRCGRQTTGGGPAFKAELVEVNDFAHVLELPNGDQYVVYTNESLDNALPLITF